MHEQFLFAALEQAWLGRGMCAPNPAVGAVAVRNGKIIAQAYHSGAGQPHAERVLLSALPTPCDGITVYVTLEPCNHWGKTPPCVDGLIAQGIERVVYAYADPNPLVVNNNTPARLRAAGIEVLHVALAEIDAFYRSYHHWLTTGMPWVTVKIAHTLDGKIAGPGGARARISNAICAEFTHKNRLHSDVLLTTASTINQDNPYLNARIADACIQKPVAILDSSNQLNPWANVFNTASKVCIYYAHDAAIPTPIAAHCHYYSVPRIAPHRLDLAAVLRHLGSLGYHDVWVEAGARLFTALHQAGLVQRTLLYVVPRVLGESAYSLYTEAGLFELMSGIEWQPMGDNLLASIDWTKKQEALCSRD